MRGERWSVETVSGGGARCGVRLMTWLTGGVAVVAPLVAASTAAGSAVHRGYFHCRCARGAQSQAAGSGGHEVSGTAGVTATLSLSLSNNDVYRRDELRFRGIP